MRRYLDTLSLALFVLFVWALVIVAVPVVTVWRWMR